MKRFVGILMMLGCLLCAGCATEGLELVARQISNAELMIQEAREKKAEEYSPLKLKLAEENLEEAQKALNDEDVDAARRKAEMAMENARVAKAQSEAKLAEERAEDEEKDVKTLKNEIERIQKNKKQ